MLVTDGEQRAALAIVRSLGRAGYHVHVSSAHPAPIAAASRFCREVSRTPDPLTDPEGFVNALVAICGQREVSALLPVSDAALLSLLPARTRFPGIRIPFPDAERFRHISDKAAVLQTAGDLGIPTPEQRLLNSAADLSGAGALGFRFPLVLKPARSVGELKGSRRKLNVSYAGDWNDLKDRVRKLPVEAFPLLLQERIVGPGTGIFVLLWDDKVLALFAHRRLREKPPAGGVSVYSESIYPDPDLAERAVTLLRCFKWQGPAMVEFKLDRATGTPYLMEVNGRFWGSLQLAIDAGVDFPALLLEAALGTPPAPVLRYRAGGRSRWWWGDVDHLLARLRRSRKELALPADAPTRWQAVLAFLTLWRPGDRSEVFRLDDPLPAIRETVNWFLRR